MTLSLKGSFVAALALGLAGCGSGSQQDAGTQAAPEGASSPAAASTPAATTAVNAAPVAFGICSSCHAVEKGKTLIGPSLAGVYGTKAGEVAGFTFSPALKASGLTWDDATLDKWLENPMKLVPGTKMTYAGQADPAKRQELIAYLKTLK